VNIVQHDPFENGPNDEDYASNHGQVTHTFRTMVSLELSFDRVLSAKSVPVLVLNTGSSQRRMAS